MKSRVWKLKDADQVEESSQLLGICRVDVRLNAFIPSWGGPGYQEPPPLRVDIWSSTAQAKIGECLLLQAKEK